MVKVIIEEENKTYQCEECNFDYKEKEWAEKCEAWCKEHQTCNIEITRHATQQPEDSNSQV